MKLKIMTFLWKIKIFSFQETFLNITPLKQILVKLHLFRFTHKDVIQNKFKGLEGGEKKKKKSQIKALLRGPPAAYWSNQANAELSKGRPTWQQQFPAHGEHDLAVACCIGHQLQNLFVRFALDRHAVYTDQLVPGPQASVLLSCTERHNGADVHLGTRW